MTIYIKIKILAYNLNYLKKYLNYFIKTNYKLLKLFKIKYNRVLNK
ncbi:MAG: hypothetical protein BAJALOKI1v1_980005 [Promethearchaeota archaeon]|nr:MAG: hypothetical protein BAJALOKI1v1_980005 [Candidatus Lokiarchaeota archaeon]